MIKDEIIKLLSDSKKFRTRLVENMESLDLKFINCKNCSGICCTKAKNSMMVTPIEALNLYLYLEENIKDKKMLWEKIEESVSTYGLNREIYVKGKLLRKNYTCPLFKFESWGCPIDPYLKPLGCLGFNATEVNVTDGKNCQSDINLLSITEDEFSAELTVINNKLKDILKLSFDKKPIPTALLEIRLKLK